MSSPGNCRLQYACEQVRRESQSCVRFVSPLGKKKSEQEKKKSEQEKKAHLRHEVSGPMVERLTG